MSDALFNSWRDLLLALELRVEALIKSSMRPLLVVIVIDVGFSLLQNLFWFLLCFTFMVDGFAVAL